MSKESYTPVPKASIKPVRLVVTLEASKVNANGTFSSFNVVSVEGPNDSCGASVPNPRQAHLLRFYTNSPEGVEVRPSNSDGSKTEAAKVFDIGF